MKAVWARLGQGTMVFTVLAEAVWRFYKCLEHLTRMGVPFALVRYVGARLYAAFSFATPYLSSGTSSAVYESDGAPCRLERFARVATSLLSVGLTFTPLGIHTLSHQCHRLVRDRDRRDDRERVRERDSREREPLLVTRRLPPRGCPEPPPAAAGAAFFGKRASLPGTCVRMYSLMILRSSGGVVYDALFLKLRTCSRFMPLNGFKYATKDCVSCSNS